MNALVQSLRRVPAALFFFLCCHASAWGQPKASFAATPVSGCSPLVVYFFDSSAGNPTQWRWELGNGVTSYLRNPSATYFNPGTYSVKLIVSNSAGKDTVVRSQFITVYQSPTVAFGFDKTSGCFPLPVQFTDSSTAGSGTIVSRQWDFGDGTISTEQNPSHTYASAGTFSVTLKVFNSFGCVKSTTKEQVISISDGVNTAFSATDPGICPAPSGVQFTNASKGPGPLQFRWDFGDGSTSNSLHPAHTYTTNGTFSVRLIAISPQGCVDTLVKKDIFRIGSAKAGFNAPAGACINKAVQFLNSSSPTPLNAQWDFGDGTKSTSINPVKTYTVPGTYTVRLITNFGSCADTATKTINVTAYPVADFTFSQQAFCRLPADVKFTSLASGSSNTYFWDFGDGTTAATADPTHSYTRDGNYTIKFVVTNQNGCSDTITRKNFVRIQQPTVKIAGLPMTGCGPITVSPTASISGGQAITSYAWDFGDGTSSTDSTPTHTYNTMGNYDVRLVVTNASGCTDTVLLSRGVRLGSKPHADFSNTPATVCPYEKVRFTDKSTGGADQWFWEFGDGGTSTEQNPTHQYSDTGWQNIRLVVYNNTCPDTIVFNKAVYVNPPISIFTAKDDCNDNFTKTFVDKSLNPKTWFWEFGDGTTSTEQNPVHKYAATGSYQVKLLVTNNACSHFSYRTVSVLNEKAAFATPDTTLCRNGKATMTSTGLNKANIATWVWAYGDGTSSNDTMATSHRYTKAGDYDVSLTITDKLGCKSAKNVLVHVFGPTASFQPATAATCLKDNKVQLADRSASDGRHPIANWMWSYGDNTFDTSAAAPFAHSYAKAGTYTIGLTVVDDFGCRDSVKQTAAIVIAQPVAAFSVSDSLGCTGQVLKFTNASTGLTPVYQWSFGDGGKATVASPSHPYVTGGTYSPTLVVTDKYGCTDTARKTDFITVAYPKANFTMSDSTGTCPPLLVHFANYSTGYKSIRWDFGDGNTSVLDTPSHFYATPGIFDATLVATGYGGCTDTLRKRIAVKGPIGTFQYAPLTGCKPLTVNFKASTRNKATFIWDFSDGATQASKDTTASHSYISAGDFVPKIILTDSGGCTVAVSGIDTIRVKGVVTSFDMDKTEFCHSGPVQFSNQTVSNDYIKTYQWSFGDGGTSNEANPTHRYAAPGFYTVQMSAITEAGCTDKKTLVDTIKIYANPVVQISSDSTGCAPAAFAFNGNVKTGNPAQLKWNWSFANGQSGSGQTPDAQVYTADGAYTIATIATDNHGCSDTATKNIVVHPTPKTEVGADLWICRGSAQPLKATGAVRYSWQPATSLSCVDCAVPLAAPSDSTQYVVTGYNTFGCNSSDSITVRVHQPFTLTVDKGDTICAGKTIRLAATGADLYTWTPSLDVKNPAAGITSATPASSTLYHLVAKDQWNCFTDTGSVYIKVWPVPTVTVTDAQTLAVGSSLTLQPTYSPDVTAYQWSNAQTLSCATCPAPVAHPKTETKYNVDVKNDGGCTAQAAVTVHVICNDGNLFIPNTFTPNKDGRNDRFYPRGTGISKIKSLKIFNRWGELVFSRENFDANDAAAGWDGSFRGTMVTPDVYVYNCEVVCMNNEVLSYKGDVTLLR